DAGASARSARGERGEGSARAGPNSVDQARMGRSRGSSGRVMRGRASTDGAGSRVVITDDVLEGGGLGEGVRREAPGHDRSLHTTFVEAAVRPVAGDGQVVERVIER